MRKALKTYCLSVATELISHNTKISLKTKVYDTMFVRPVFASQFLNTITHSTGIDGISSHV